MVVLLLPLLLLLHLDLTQALAKIWQPSARQKMMLGDHNLTYNSLANEDLAMTISHPLPPALIRFRGRKPDTGEPTSHLNVRPSDRVKYESSHQPTVYQVNTSHSAKKLFPGLK